MDGAWMAPGWRSDESAPHHPTVAWFTSWAQHNNLVVFVISSRFSPRIFLGLLRFSSSTKTNTPNSNFLSPWDVPLIISSLFTYVLLLNHTIYVYEMPVRFCLPSVMMLSTLQFTSLTVVGPSIEFTFRVKSFEL